jgi:hypothetical protein
MKNKEQSMRLATAVLVGGVLMLGVFLGALAFMWFGLGPRFAFEGEGPMASVPWTIGMLLGVELGCLLAGWGAKRLAGNRSPMAIGILLGLLVVWGVATWNASRNAATRKLPDGKTIQSLSFAEAGEYSVSPFWFPLAMLPTGIGGLLLGGILAKSIPRRAAFGERLVPLDGERR